MGLNYSLCAIFAREDASEIFKHLSKHLHNEDQSRMKNVVWSPRTESLRSTLIGTIETDARDIAGLIMGQYEQDNHYCLNLLIKLESEMKAHLGENQSTYIDQPEGFGCMWTSICAGKKYVLLEMTAATSRMSRILEGSTAIHRLWHEFANQSDAILAYLDKEGEYAIQLYPEITDDFFLPDYDTLSFTDFNGFSVDLFAKCILNANEI